MSNVEKFDQIISETCESFSANLVNVFQQFFDVSHKASSQVERTSSFSGDDKVHFAILFVGSSYGEFVLSVSKKDAVKAISGSCDEDKIEEQFLENKEEIIDAFKELINISVGKVFTKLSDVSKKVTITSPKVSVGDIILPNVKLFKQHIEFEEFSFETAIYSDQMRTDLAVSYEKNLEVLECAKQELEESKHKEEELERLNEAKSEFLANMSHELRTPLNGMVGMLDLMLTTELTSLQREQLKTISSSGDFLLTIINDILEISKIESGKLEIEYREFPIRDCLKDIATAMAVNAFTKGLELVVDVSPDLPEIINCDETRIRQILINLVGNAIKFTPAGDIYLRAKLTHKDDLHFIVLEVEDTGVGIPASKKDSIFEIFSQVDASDTRKYGGSGLGLSICKSIAELMDGTISVTSEEAMGSKFTVELPIEKANSYQPKVIDKVASKALTAVGFSEVNQVLSKYLKNVGIEAENHTNLQDITAALKTLDEDRVVFLDWTLLQKDLAEVSSLLKEKGDKCRTIFIVPPHKLNQAYSEFENLDITFSHVSKPILEANLYQVLEEVYAGKKKEVSAVKAVTAGSEKVLLVEDNKVNQTVAKAMLSKSGYEVDIANNGQEAVDLYKENHYSLILMDCQMPVKDGYQATTEIREYEESESLPNASIVALTANAFRETKEKCFKCGMDAFLTKPIKLAVLNETIIKTLAKAKAS